ncbi:MAG: hypothetical protein HQM08_19220 [Candidatus Riflebacteria bacterium]|nr:hypothetical protein [Candidatus Riflebacteria bacterium]
MKEGISTIVANGWKKIVGQDAGVEIFQIINYPWKEWSQKIIQNLNLEIIKKPRYILFGPKRLTSDA